MIFLWIMSAKSRLADHTNISVFFEQYRRKPRSCWINYHNACKPCSDVLRSDSERNRIRVEFAQEKNGVTYRTGMRLPTLAPLQYSGATSKMQAPENSWLARRNRISLSHRNRCVSPSYSRGANRNGEGRWCSRRRNVSLGIRNERRARISGEVGGPQIAPRFPATTNGGYRYGKGGGEKSERCGSVVGCVLAEAVRPLPPTLLPPPCPSPSRHAFGFRGNITRKWWLACECRYHFLARYQPARPVITAPPGLRHGLLDKPPTAKVYCVFHVPSPSIRFSFSSPRLLFHLVLSGSLMAFLYS